MEEMNTIIENHIFIRKKLRFYCGKKSDDIVRGIRSNG